MRPIEDLAENDGRRIEIEREIVKYIVRGRKKEKERNFFFIEMIKIIEMFFLSKMYLIVSVSFCKY